MELTIHNAIIHKLDKIEGQPAQIVSAPKVLQQKDEPLQQLVQDVHTVYGSREGKSYGKFDPELTPVSAEPHLQRLRDKEDADFYAISIDLMRILKTRADEKNFATGGHVLMFDYSMNGARWFVVAVVNSAPGTMVDENFKVVKAPHLDVAGIRFAGRVNFTEWMVDAQRYISFLRGKSAEVSKYFQNFLGCSTVVQDLQDTRNLVRIVKQFAVDKQLDDAAREKLLAEVDEIARCKAKDRLPLDLAELVHRVWPQEPDALRNALTTAETPIPDGFVPQTRGLAGLVRFKAKTKTWKLEFEREAYQDDTIDFDEMNGTLTIRNIPTDILSDLVKEFKTNAIPDDSADAAGAALPAARPARVA